MKIPTIRRQILMCRRFTFCQQAQDMVEYALLLAFVGLGIAAMGLAISDPLSGIWSTANSHLKKGHAYAKGHYK